MECGLAHVHAQYRCNVCRTANSIASIVLPTYHAGNSNSLGASTLLRAAAAMEASVSKSESRSGGLLAPDMVAAVAESSTQIWSEQERGGVRWTHLL